MRWVWLAVAVVAVGCGSSVPESEKSWSRFGVGAEPAPANWTTYNNEGGGIAMNLPPHWTEDDGTPASRKLIRESIAAQIPDFPGLETRNISMSTQFLDGVNLDPEQLKTGIIPTLTVSLQKLDSKLDLTDVRRQFESAQQVPDSIKEVKLPIGTALHIVRSDQLLSLVDQSPIKTKIHTYCIGRDRYLWMIKFEISEADTAGTELIETAIKSVRINKPDFDRLTSDYEARQKHLKDERRKQSQEENEEYMRKQDEAIEQRRREEEERRRAEEAERLQQEQNNLQQTPLPVQDPPVQDLPGQNPPTQDPPPDSSGG